MPVQIVKLVDPIQLSVITGAVPAGTSAGTGMIWDAVTGGWIETTGTLIVSAPPAGCYRVVNIYMDADEKIVVKYEDTPV